MSREKDQGKLKLGMLKGKKVYVVCNFYSALDDFLDKKDHFFCSKKFALGIP